MLGVTCRGLTCAVLTDGCRDATALVMFYVFFFLMIRRPPRSTLDRSSAASDVYKRQLIGCVGRALESGGQVDSAERLLAGQLGGQAAPDPVSYTHLRAHETVLDLVCRLLLEKKKKTHTYHLLPLIYPISLLLCICAISPISSHFPP